MEKLPNVYCTKYIEKFAYFAFEKVIKSPYSFKFEIEIEPVLFVASQSLVLN